MNEEITKLSEYKELSFFKKYISYSSFLCKAVEYEKITNKDAHFLWELKLEQIERYILTKEIDRLVRNAEIGLQQASSCSTGQQNLWAGAFSGSLTSLSIISLQRAEGYQECLEKLDKGEGLQLFDRP